MRCEACGLEYGLTHNCPGPAAAPLREPLPPPPEVEFSPLKYAQLAWNVARMQERAIQIAARDNNCFIYGSVGYVMAFALIVASDLLRNPEHFEGAPAELLIGMSFGLNVLVLWQIGIFAICHWIAKLFFGGVGTFAAILRPLAITSFLLALAAIPGVGVLAAGIWWSIAVLSAIFEQLHQIERRKAIFTVLGVNFTSNMLLRYLDLF